MRHYDCVVIGGGPAGLAAASSAHDEGSKVLLIEREGVLGGILKQCIHDGFGVTRFKKRLSGPEYAHLEIEKIDGVEVSLLTFVTKIENEDKQYKISIVNRQGTDVIYTPSVVFATGCRERTAKQIAIHGTNPSGVMTAGNAQYYINILGMMPTKKCVILGSGDIGLIMARRITLEGGTVEGVYEVKSTPSGLSRNIVQCLDDFNIPLYLSHTVTKVFGVDRLEAVEIHQVDEKMNIIPNTEKKVECDALILSVGLIPENELAKSLDVTINPDTKGPDVDQSLMTNKIGIYSCGNAVHVNDLADYVSESGEIAGKNASRHNVGERELIRITKDKQMLYLVPNMLDLKGELSNIVFYFRSKEQFENKILRVVCNQSEIYSKTYSQLKPPEMERIVINIPTDVKDLEFRLEDK